MSSLILTLFPFLSPCFSDISHFQEQNDLKGLLENLHQNIQAKKRKNVEIMWLAATVSPVLPGLTRCHRRSHKHVACLLGRGQQLCAELPGAIPHHPGDEVFPVLSVVVSID